MKYKVLRSFTYINYRAETDDVIDIENSSMSRNLLEGGFIKPLEDKKGSKAEINEESIASEKATSKKEK